MLYQAHLLDHFKKPRCHGSLDQPSFVSIEANPLCGDLVRISGVVVNGLLQKAAFVGEGCVISQAAASLLLEYCVNRSISDIQRIGHAEILDLVKLSLGPNRLKCALLPLVALQKGIAKSRD